MSRSENAVFAVVALILLFLPVVLFVPFFGVEAPPPGFQPYSTIMAVQGNQTKMITLVSTPRTYGSTASLSYCFWGKGALLQDGKYYLFTISQSTGEGAFCPTPQS